MPGSSPLRVSRRGVLLGAGALTAGACASTPRGATVAAPRLACTLILVRHAEKLRPEDMVMDGTRDPALSSAGEERAKEFARMFERAGVTSILHSGLIRTRDTLAPLAARTGIEPESLPPSDIARWAERIAAAGPDEVLAVAGHSNTVPAIAWAFGVQLPDLDPSGTEPHGDLPHTAYDRIHVLTPGVSGEARLLEMRYGAPS